MPIVIDRLRGLFRFELFGQVLFFFMAGSPFCTLSAYPLGAYRIPLGDRPSHSISVTLSTGWPDGASQPAGLGNWDPPRS